MTRVALAAWRTDLILETRGEVGSELLLELLRQRVAAVDLAASRFRPDSEATRIAAAAGEWVPVSPLMARLVRTAVAVAQATDGLVHPGLGAPAIGAGYDAWAGLTPLAAGSTRVLPWQEIEFTDHAVRVPPGMVLDLGASAKAWLADHLATVVHGATVAPVVANMGGDLRCIGDYPWPILLEPEHPAAAVREITITDGAVATSGLAARRWAGGHHIIDPRTGLPARTHWWSVAVIAADAVGANAAATASIVMGPDAPRWLRNRGLTARLVDQAGVAVDVSGKEVAAA